MRDTLYIVILVNIYIYQLYLCSDAGYPVCSYVGHPLIDPEVEG